MNIYNRFEIFKEFLFFSWGVVLVIITMAMIIRILYILATYNLLRIVLNTF